MKKCFKCGEQKPLSDFYKHKGNKDGFQKRCKPCDIKIAHERYNADPQKAALKRFKQRLKREYGISFEEYENMVSVQNNCCAICETILGTGMRIHIDHDHNTRKVRGILCRWCNLMLGHAKDRIQNLENAIQYLKRHS